MISGGIRGLELIVGSLGYGRVALQFANACLSVPMALWLFVDISLDGEAIGC